MQETDQRWRRRPCRRPREGRLPAGALVTRRTGRPPLPSRTAFPTSTNGKSLCRLAQTGGGRPARASVSPDYLPDRFPAAIDLAVMTEDGLEDLREPLQAGTGRSARGGCSGLARLRAEHESRSSPVRVPGRQPDRKLRCSACGSRGEPEGRAAAVAIDMSYVYIRTVRDHLPQASLVFDRFHVVKSMNAKLSDLPKPRRPRRAFPGAQKKPGRPLEHRERSGFSGKWAWVDSNYRPHAYQAKGPGARFRHPAAFPHVTQRAAGIRTGQDRVPPESVDTF